MTAAGRRSLKLAAWSAAGGFAFGWVAKDLAFPPAPYEPPPPVVAVAPQVASAAPAPAKGYVLSDGRVVTSLDAPDPAALVFGGEDPCVPTKPAPRRRK
jgi:hypothetical protein